MDTEIRNYFEEALESPSPVSEQPETADQAVIDYAIASAVTASGTRDPELLELLLRRAKLGLEEGTVTGLREAMEDLRETRPFLFEDGGNRPRFSAATQGRSLSREDAAVAKRYRNNPWYRG
ncbi:MAG: phage scaffolding protein [Oscillospiraceae bacterium]|nr:phage scaffolding protein [Oscillospiraceae bacterium]